LCVAPWLVPVLIMTDCRSQINSDKPAFIDFWAAWCGPCRAISPVFERLSESAPGGEFYKVDVDSQPDISQEVGIRAVRPPPLASSLGARSLTAV
jgi:thioredoxin 1